MLLVTKGTTLKEFIEANSIGIVDPKTKALSTMHLANTLNGRKKFMYTVQVDEAGSSIKYLRETHLFKNIIIASSTEVLRLLKEGKYMLDY